MHTHELAADHLSRIKKQLELLVCVGICERVKQECTLASDDLTFTLSGNIRHQGLPLSGVIVVLYEAGYGSSAASRKLLSQQKTGSRGDFHFAVPAGTYCLELIPDSSTRFVRQLVSGINISTNISMPIGLSTGFILKGAVLTGSGGTISNCLVTIIGIEPSGFRAVADVDSSGCFSVILPRGKYYLVPAWCAAEPSPDGRTAEVPFLTRYTEVVHLTSDATHDFVLPDLAEVVIQVADQAGSKVADTKISVVPLVSSDHPLSQEISLPVQTLTDSSGACALKLEAGDYQLVLTPPEGSPLCAMSFASVPLGRQEAETFLLQEGSRLRGRVSFAGAAVPSGVVKLRSRDGQLAYSAITDEAGKFMFRAPAGTYELTVIPKKERFRRHTERIAGPWSRTLELGAVEIRVDVDLGCAQPVVGYVRDANGLPRTGVTVAACLDRAGAASGADLAERLAEYTSDSSGRFKLRLAAGKYHIYIVEDPSAMQQIEVKGEPVHIELTYQGCLKVRFEVSGQDGARLSRCKIVWVPYGADRHFLLQSKDSVLQLPAISGWAFTGDDGCCELELPPGVYTFYFQPVAGSDYQGKEIRQLSVSADTTRKVKLVAKPDNADSQLTLDFSPDLGAD